MMGSAERDWGVRRLLEIADRLRARRRARGATTAGRRRRRIGGAGRQDLHDPARRQGLAGTGLGGHHRRRHDAQRRPAHRRDVPDAGSAAEQDRQGAGRRHCRPRAARIRIHGRHRRARRRTQGGAHAAGGPAVLGLCLCRAREQARGRGQGLRRDEPPGPGGPVAQLPAQSRHPGGGALGPGRDASEGGARPPRRQVRAEPADREAEGRLQGGDPKAGLPARALQEADRRPRPVRRRAHRREAAAARHRLRVSGEGGRRRRAAPVHPCGGGRRARLSHHRTAGLPGRRCPR